ncbi:hypothetical protein [Achromobacter aloeverae]|uniref:Uncharacterized protein n=1 Tax=Achromobacter aloeverae TaxID=1750518 RepID=A0A4Q1HPI8_9BURK|nr:hypothetical protein [Achromobacter aloeverae]RXN92954.1 hypothetical protein C7R54_04245 [Achromobacter aloeverae]
MNDRHSSDIGQVRHHGVAALSRSTHRVLALALRVLAGLIALVLAAWAGASAWSQLLRPVERQNVWGIAAGLLLAWGAWWLLVSSWRSLFGPASRKADDKRA